MSAGLSFGDQIVSLMLIYRVPGMSAVTMLHLWYANA